MECLLFKGIGWTSIHPIYHGHPQGCQSIGKHGNGTIGVGILAETTSKGELQTNMFAIDEKFRKRFGKVSRVVATIVLDNLETITSALTRVDHERGISIVVATIAITIVALVVATATLVVRVGTTWVPVGWARVVAVVASTSIVTTRVVASRVTRVASVGAFGFLVGVWLEFSNAFLECMGDQELGVRSTQSIHEKLVTAEEALSMAPCKFLTHP